jgi:hypothetical protein
MNEGQFINERVSNTPYQAVDPEDEEYSGCCSAPSAKFVSTPLILFGLLAFSFSTVWVLYMQISDSADLRDAGIVFGFYPQLLLFGWWYGIDLLVWSHFNIPSRELLNLKSDSMDGFEMLTFISIASILVFFGYVVFSAGFRDVTLSVVMVMAGLTYLVMPGPIPFKSGRWKFLSSLKECVFAAFGCVPVEFWHTFVTDGMTSASLLIWEAEYGFCCVVHRSSLVAKYHSGLIDGDNDSGVDCAEGCGKGSYHNYIMQPLMYSIPFWLRLCQEVRRKNWWNVLKYVSCLVSRLQVQSV